MTLYKSNNWEVIFGGMCQEFLGYCIIVSKKTSLSELTSEEWIELGKLEKELETLPVGAKLMTYEVGIRFLADYINGDVYFRISRPEQNLDRCRTQLKLVEEIEKLYQEMLAVTQSIYTNLK